jgi:tuberous sclerosis 2
MYINPPLSATLLSIADHLADVDTANLPAVMLQQQDLSPTAAGWLSNWESLFKHSTMLDSSRPLTRQGIMQTLQIVYDSVKDMPKYRKQLANLVYDFCERQVADGNQDGEAMWRILGDEVVLRTVEAEATEVDVDINSIAAVGHMVSLLSGAALERDGDGDDAVSISSVENRSPSPHHATVPDTSSPSSPATLPRIQTDNAVKDKDSNLPSVMAAVLTSLTTATVPRSPSLHPQVADEPPPAMLSGPAPLDPNPFSRPVSAVVALVNIFSQLAFTPLSFSQTTLELAIQIFLDIVKVLVEGDSSMAKLTALQFLTRLRADRAHRLYLVDTHYDPDGHIRSLAVLIDRYVAEDPDGGDYHGNLGEPTFKRRARPRRPRNENARQPAQGRGARLSTSSGSRPRAPFHSSTSVVHPPAPKTQEPLWSVPEQIPFLLRDIDTPSEIIVSYAPAGPDNTIMLPLSVYLAALIDILGDGTDWEVFSYILCHLPVQLANKHLFCGPKCRKIMPKLLQTLGRRIIEGKFASEIDRWPQGIKPRDAQGLAFHTLSVIIGYSPCLDVQHCHLLVEVLQFGLNHQPSTIKCCLHALSLAAFELPTSMTRCLSRILDNLSKIMSNPNMAVHILAFLSIVVSLPHLYSNFTENDFKMVFGVALKYLQYHNPGSSPTSSWALSQHVRFISYYVVYAWFLAVKLQDRPRHVGYITRELLIANEGRDEVDDYTQVCFDWLARYTYGSADPRPANSLLDEVVMNPTAPDTPTQIPLSEKAWVWGNSIVNIRALSRLGWIEVITRRPSGMTKFLCRVENVPLVGPGEADFDPVSVLASLVMDYRPPSAPAPLQDASPSNQVYQAICATFVSQLADPMPLRLSSKIYSPPMRMPERNLVQIPSLDMCGVELRHLRDENM